jgi:hypothetical protein
MTVDAQHFQARNVLVGFRAMPLIVGKPTTVYSAARIKASLENTTEVYLGPASNVTTTFDANQGFPLSPGEYIDLQITTLALFAIADDIGQEIHLAGL